MRLRVRSHLSGFIDVSVFSLHFASLCLRLDLERAISTLKAVSVGSVLVVPVIRVQEIMGGFNFGDKENWKIISTKTRYDGYDLMVCSIST